MASLEVDDLGGTEFEWKGLEFVDGHFGYCFLYLFKMLSTWWQHVNNKTECFKIQKILQFVAISIFGDRWWPQEKIGTIHLLFNLFDFSYGSGSLESACIICKTTCNQLKLINPPVFVTKYLLSSLLFSCPLQISRHLLVANLVNWLILNTVCLEPTTWPRLVMIKRD